MLYMEVSDVVESDVTADWPLTDISLLSGHGPSGENWKGLWQVCVIFLDLIEGGLVKSYALLSPIAPSGFTASNLNKIYGTEIVISHEKIQKEIHPVTWGKVCHMQSNDIDISISIPSGTFTTHQDCSYLFSPLRLSLKLLILAIWL